MLISKFDLYEAGWLDLVFETRNKEYGAYDLRQHYANNMARAMVITFSLVFLLCGAAILFRTQPAIHPNYDPGIIITISDPTISHPPLAHPKKPVVPVALAKPLPPVKTIQFLPPKVVPDNVSQKPPLNDHLGGQIGQTTNLKGSDEIDIPEVKKPGGSGPTAPIDDGGTIHPPIGLDAMPMPVGGDAAWAKFLNKNLHFPGQAHDDNASGRVFISFVIEKDGSLSNFTLEKPAGHGFDEEALRVLQLAKPWKPGMQNGKPVRVRYVIPINFQLSEEN